MVSDVFALFSEALRQIGTQEWVGLVSASLLLAAMVYWLAMRFVRQWNKQPRYTSRIRVLALGVGALGFALVPLAYSLRHVESVASRETRTWVYDLLSDDIWSRETYLAAHDSVKALGLEAAVSEATSRGQSMPPIPVGSPASREALARTYVQRINANFAKDRQLLNWLLRPNEADNVSLLIEDMDRHFGGAGSQRAMVVSTMDDFRNRLIRESAQTGDVQISLAWDNTNDLDLHCIDPSGTRIYHGNKTSPSGGRLDVDMNVGSRISSEPVENIFWPHNGAPRGQYQVKVKYYKQREAGDGSSPYRVRVRRLGVHKDYSGTISVEGDERVVTTFTFPPTEADGAIVDPYDASKGIGLMMDAIRVELEAKGPRAVLTARLVLIGVFLLAVGSLLGGIAYSAYSDIQVH